jgi:cellulose synthase/poly-beta-1,6-N-acetylglucosamine synthase-like glycosyltransferase
MILPLLILFIVLALYYYNFLLKVARGIEIVKKSEFNSSKKYFVSVIIPFRNESENILDSLLSLLEQTYPKELLEIIYVDDNSTDDSYQKLTNAIRSQNIKVIKIPKGFSPYSYKKRAIRFGLEQAKGEIIVGTDADCVHPKLWLEKLISCFDDSTAFVSAPVVFKNEENLFAKLQKMEFASLILAGAGLIGIKHPAICNAANIAYRKNVFNKVRGFDDNFSLSSGDDEFLMQKIAGETKYEIKFCFSEDVLVKTLSNKKIKDFYHQRKRWASKSLYYKDFSLVLKIIMIFFFYLSFPVQLLLGLLLFKIFIGTFIIFFIIKMILEYKIMIKGIPVLYRQVDVNIFIISELLHIPYILISAITGLFGNFVWKDRKLTR